MKGRYNIQVCDPICALNDFQGEGMQKIVSVDCKGGKRASLTSLKNLYFYII